MDQNEIIRLITQKYHEAGENPDTYLKGLLYAKPINYWDYIATDTLLSLQKTRTDFKDELIFIVYHQVTELILKMMNHEIGQLVSEQLPQQVWMEKTDRLIRYTGMLINSFDVMRWGMRYDDYNVFRHTLAPASGFQSVQFREVEIACTRLVNLVNEKGRERLPEHPGTADFFQHLYWKDAGTNHLTGEKKLTLRQFEEKYGQHLVLLAEKCSGRTLEEQAMSFDPLLPGLAERLKTFDRLYNIDWPMVHLRTAQYYLDSKGENKAATGGSEWKKYLHPRFQQRKFFPFLWSVEEKNTWGRDQSGL